MRITGSIGLWMVSTLLAIALGSTPRAAEVAPRDVDFDKLKQGAGADLGTPEGMSFMKGSQKALEAAIRSAFRKCSGQAPVGGTVAFEFVAGVSADGVLEGVRVRREDPFGACIAKELASNKIGAPPKQPFHIYVYMGGGR